MSAPLYTTNVDADILLVTSPAFLQGWLEEFGAYQENGEIILSIGCQDWTLDEWRVRGRQLIEEHYLPYNSLCPKSHGCRACTQQRALYEHFGITEELAADSFTTPEALLHDRLYAELLKLLDDIERWAAKPEGASEQ